MAHDDSPETLDLGTYESIWTIAGIRGTCQLAQRTTCTQTQHVSLSSPEPQALKIVVSGKMWDTGHRP
jgi:hypothetical protein